MSRGEDLLARVTWSRIAEPGDRVAVRLLESASPAEALAALRAAPESRAGQRFAPRLRGYSAHRDLEVGARCGARVVIPGDPEWPTQLDDLAQPPVCLWVRGRRLPPAEALAVSVVGARAATAYGEQIAGELGYDLADRAVVVSGAAFGIDAAAHRGTLGAAGVTVAVLAGGVERPYPAAHDRLLAQIAEAGSVVSEVAPGSAPTRSRFLQRNRLIAALAGGVVVVEAGLRSGSLNTARHAADLGRPVGAVPGPVTSPASAGCHELVRDGRAVLVTDADEVVELIGPMGLLAPPKRGPSGPADDLDPEELRVWETLSAARGATVERVARGAGLGEREVVGILAGLEVRGLASRGDDVEWRRVGG